MWERVFLWLAAVSVKLESMWKRLMNWRTWWRGRP